MSDMIICYKETLKSLKGTNKGGVGGIRIQIPNVRHVDPFKSRYVTSHHSVFMALSLHIHPLRLALAL